MVSHALHASCLQREFAEVVILVDFAKENCIMTHVAPYNLKQLVLASDFKIIKVLLKNQVQVRYLIDGLVNKDKITRFLTDLYETESTGPRKLLNNHVDKKIKVSDFLRALIEARKLKEITLPQFKSNFLKVLIELQDYLDFDEIFLIAIQYKLMETLFQFAESQKLDEERRDAFAFEFFKFSLRQEMIDMAVLVQEMYEEHLMRSVNSVLETLIQSLNKNSRHADMKVHILAKYIEFLKFS